MVKITERKTKVDCACFIEEIASYESAEKITLVMDNLNTHNPGSLYEVFSPDKAKGVVWDAKANCQFTTENARIKLSRLYPDT